MFTGKVAVVTGSTSGIGRGRERADGMTSADLDRTVLRAD